MPKLEKLYTEKDDCFLSINNILIGKNEENTRIYYIYICSIYIVPNIMETILYIFQYNGK